MLREYRSDTRERRPEVQRNEQGARRMSEGNTGNRDDSRGNGGSVNGIAVGNRDGQVGYHASQVLGSIPYNERASVNHEPAEPGSFFYSANETKWIPSAFREQFNVPHPCCRCMPQVLVTCRRTRNTTNNNFGRYYFTCANNRCGYYRFVDEFEVLVYARRSELALARAHDAEEVQRLDTTGNGRNNGGGFDGGNGSGGNYQRFMGNNRGMNL